VFDGYYIHRRAHFAETANVNYRLSLPTKEKSNFCFSFAENRRKFAISIFQLQQAKESCRFLLVRFPYIDIDTAAYINI
jgi:hypothetical protein